MILVAGESPWPARQGGLVRTAGIAEALSSELHLTLVSLTGEVPPDSPVEVRVVGSSALRHTRSSDFLSGKPRLGRLYLQGDPSRRVAEICAETSCVAVIFAQSYLAAIDPVDHLPKIVDFQNVEVQRLRSLSHRGRPHNRASATWEGLKARHWESRVARSAALCLAVDKQDERSLARWGATTLVIPNTISKKTQVAPSPRDGAVLFLASADYPPNRDAGRWLVKEVWPLVLEVLPSAKLWIAGRASNAVFAEFASVVGVTIIGEVESVLPLFQAAAVVAAPVKSGAGRQLKVVEALAAGRVVVATHFSRRSVPDELAEMSYSADSVTEFAHALTSSLVDVEQRHSRERAGALALRGIPTWAEAAEPLIELIKGFR